MKKIISIRITDQDERRIKEIKEWYKKTMPLSTEFTTTDIIRSAIRLLHYDLIIENKIKSNK